MGIFDFRAAIVIEKYRSSKECYLLNTASQGIGFDIFLMG